MTALQQWTDWLDSWALPPAILAQADDSPWVLPRQVFTARADRQIAEPSGPSYQALAESLQTPGTILDVGAGAGAASLPLVGRVPVTSLAAVDNDEELLAAFAARADRAGVPARTVQGWWPDVAADVAPADVVVAAHVVYNIRDLAPFVHALTAHARRLVLLELSDRHPLTALNPLWETFHGLVRPTRPTADDCIAALAEAGIEAKVTRWSRPAEAEYASFDELVEVTRRRLCLSAGAAPEVAAALRDLGHDPAVPPDLGSSGRQLVTLVWEGTARVTSAR